MRDEAPPWLGSTSIVDDRERYAAMTADERLQAFVEVCELARAILQGRPDALEVLARAEPMAPHIEQTWRRLVAEARRGRTDR